jgi:AcrR family transcriptional regulator
MQHINPRILRAEADKFDRQQRFPDERDRQKREHILTAAGALLARHGRHAITFGAMAAALRMAPATLRRHFIDLDALLGEILNRHLLALAAALGEVPFNDPDRARKKRQAYFTYTRAAFGGLTEAHLLYTRDRHLLPEDILTSLEQIREGLGQFLAGPPHARTALLLLDTPYIPLADIESMLAALPQEATTEATTEDTTQTATQNAPENAPENAREAPRSPGLPAPLCLPIRLRPTHRPWLRIPLPTPRQPAASSGHTRVAGGIKRDADDG